MTQLWNIQLPFLLVRSWLVKRLRELLKGILMTCEELITIMILSMYMTLMRLERLMSLRRC